MNKLVEYLGKGAAVAVLYAGSNSGVDYLGEKFDAKWLDKELFEIGDIDIEPDDLIALVPFFFLWLAVRK